jgi:hypothetical protein
VDAECEYFRLGDLGKPFYRFNFALLLGFNNWIGCSSIPVLVFLLILFVIYRYVSARINRVLVFVLKVRVRIMFNFHSRQYDKNLNESIEMNRES